MGKTIEKDKRNDFKNKVRDFWEDEVCGTRYGVESDDKTIDLEQMAKARYRLEPYIPEFAEFQSAKGKEVLEIGVGGGVDFASWLKAGAKAAGIDLTDQTATRRSWISGRFLSPG
jgi:2-polyprenyl-3-methyl-5-hydroxy-6-metoxy-1,4-benzoquinol methylase